jgi:hypothetical protein
VEATEGRLWLMWLREFLTWSGFQSGGCLEEAVLLGYRPGDSTGMVWRLPERHELWGLGSSGSSVHALNSAPSFSLGPEATRRGQGAPCSHAWAADTQAEGGVLKLHSKHLNLFEIAYILFSKSFLTSGGDSAGVWTQSPATGATPHPASFAFNCFSNKISYLCPGQPGSQSSYKCFLNSWDDQHSTTPSFYWSRWGFTNFFAWAGMELQSSLSLPLK